MNFEPDVIRKKAVFKKVSAAVDEDIDNPGNPAKAGLLNLQRTVGNQSVLQRMDRYASMQTLNAIGLGPLMGSNLAMQRAPGAVDKKKSFVPKDAPAWAVEDAATIKAMQKELKRLGLYTLAEDGDYGAGTDSALVEAFGGDKFRSMPKRMYSPCSKGPSRPQRAKKGSRPSATVKCSKTACSTSRWASATTKA